MSRASRRFAGIAVTAGLLGASAIGVPPASAQSTPPPTLSGEILISQSGFSGDIICGSSGSFSFAGSGTATEPYPGSFTETGSGTVTNPDVSSEMGSLSFTARFTINSPNGRVTGTKTFNGTSGACYQDANNFDVGASNTRYQATIDTTQGNYADQGTAISEVAASNALGLFTTLYESFTSSQSQPTLIEPTSLAQCKNGGYENFPQFKNQGQCVAYVEPHGGGS